MKKLASLETIAQVHRAFRMGNLFMILTCWKDNRETVETLGYGRIALLVAHCTIALKTANDRLDFGLRAKFELRQASNAIRILDNDPSVSPSLVDTLDTDLRRVEMRLDPTLRIFSDYFVVA